MPVTIPMAQPADLAGAFLRGAQTSAQIRDAQQRLQQQGQEAQMRADQEQQRLQQQHAVEQQRIAVTQAYQQQQIGLRKQQLDQVKAVNDAKTASAARQFQARQQWERGFAQIDADTSLTPEQKDAAKTRMAVQLAPTMGIPGNELVSTLRAMRPEKPTVPASVKDTGDFMQITQPNGTVVLHPKPKTSADKDANVKVRLTADAPPTTMSRSQAEKAISMLPDDVRNDPVNLAVVPSGMSQLFSRLKGSNVPRGTVSPQFQSPRYENPDAVKAAYKAGQLSRADAVKILREQFGHE